MVSRNPGGAALYLQIAEELKQDLSKLKYGERIPSEAELMEHYHVSRGTVRQAVNGLVGSGYLYKLQGKGTYRGSGLPNYEVFSRIPSYSRSILITGRVPAIFDVYLTSCEADEEVAGYLSIPIGEPVWCLSRYRGAQGDSPSCYAEAYIPKDVLPQLQAEDLELSLISMITTRFGIAISSTSNSLSAVIAGEERGKRFGIDPNMAILLTDYVMRREDGRPIVYDRSVNWDTEFRYAMESYYSLK